ncbi:uncharacterized protein [Epargyreus clarus]|uniref:uncharacterized protein n=1 Tax=Epargyreus clarus TaxID=520877 RepID=UPI003C2AC081
MESSSDDSFLWTDASSESTNMGIETVASDHEGESASRASFKHDERLSPLGNNIEKGFKKKSKKRKLSESSNISQTVKKRIKLEPESDVEARKKRKLGKYSVDSNIPQNCVSNDDNYLHKKVKQEQESLMEHQVVKSKKKNKHQISISDIHNENHSHSFINFDEKHTEEYLDMRVKQEQESFLIPDVEKSKRKKKNKSLNFDVENDIESQVVEKTNSSETENYLNMRVKQEQESMLKPEEKSKKKKKLKISSPGSVTEESESQSSNIANNHLVGAEQTDIEYSVIEDKFSAEDTVINKPKKKKRHKRDDESIGSSNIDKSSVDTKHENSVISKEYSDGNSDNDISVQPNDFNCNNIVSSTIINNSTIDIIGNRRKQVSITEDLLETEKMHKTTKISDRIRFEEDENSSHQDLNLKQQSSRVQAFLKANPQLQVLSSITQYNSIITVDDEIWILRCPREITDKRLKNGNLTLEGKCKFKIDGQTYDGNPNEDISRITHVAYQNGQTSIMNLPVKGCVHYRKRIPKAHIPDNLSMINNQTNFIPLPETKCRHPLLGANYKKAIKIPPVVAARLEAAKDRNNETFESTKKKKHKKNKKKSMDVKMEEDCEPEILEPPVKKNRKRKHAEDTDVPPKKTKRIKQDPHSAEVWESEQAIEENLFNF